MLQPNSLKKQQRFFIQKLTFLDAGFLFIGVILSFAIALNITFVSWLKVVIVISILLPWLLFLINIPSQNMRLYRLVFCYITYAFTQKQYNNKNKNKKQLIAYSKIYKDSVKTKKGNYLKIIHFKGINPFVESEFDKNIKLNQIANIFDQFNVMGSLIKRKEKNNYQDNLINIQQNGLNKIDQLENTSNIQAQEVFGEYYSQVLDDFERLQNSNNEMVDNYYFVIYEKQYQKLNELVDSTMWDLTNIGIDCNLLDAKASVEFIANLHHWKIDQEKLELALEQANKIDQDDEEEVDSVVYQTLVKLKNKTQKQQDFISLDEVFDFDEVIFKSNHYIQDNQYHSIQSIRRYPTQLQENWLSILLQSDSDLIVHFECYDDEGAHNLLNRVNKKLIDNSQETKNVIRSKFNDLEYQAISYITDQVITNGNKLVNLNVLLMNQSDSLKELKKQEELNRRFCSKFKIYLNGLMFRQFQALATSALSNQDLLNDNTQFSTVNLANGWGFNNDYVNDGNDFYLGNSISTGEPIIWEKFYKKSMTRTNYNQFVFGVSGSGKSTFVKKQILNAFANDRKVIIIDPQNEYSKLAKMLGGNVIDLGVGNGISINPLQVNNQLSSGNNITNESIINKHIDYLQLFFNIVFENNMTEKRTLLLNVALQNLYKKWKFYDDKLDFRKLSNQDYPIISDLIQELKSITFSNKEEKLRKYQDQLDLIELLEYFFENQGKYQTFYNNHTNINLDNDLIVFNTQKIQNKQFGKLKGDATSQLAIFVILNFIQNLVINNFLTNKNKFLNIFVDEVHLYIDSNNPVGLDFIYTMVKTVRKFNASMNLTTQNPSELIYNEYIKSQTIAILENCQYTTFFNLRKADIEAVNDMYSFSGGLTENELNFLATASKGQVLFSMNQNSRTRIQLHYNDIEQYLIFE
ncbi:DUF87 domain-containing protein [Mycoplasma sp. NEAQ87857]|uniref:Mbov_0397 family ICE element conjugal transfer ATPase n=1 Tax=Mycoplasma sp. NEAQ87857 TaxID=2683967 RepID=UPI001315E059|nr:DUF87 domain-containing protein [Mycoplasma sp. NEAQ87857]QGZ97973.1 DUF87 domain-containing protein [Mycoplasma sp. NEAQ87857]